ncbi:MAG: hypothetical protein KJT03_05895, partial [Verrucomicrobiae bacterium]|nr:hypothetical protein [Verrucomicrobiae bacterium]
GLSRTLQAPLSEVLRNNLLGINLGRIYPELEGYKPSDLLPTTPLRKITARHTVGLGDPLRDGDIDQPLNDGLPHSLEASIQAYGLDHFKIKLCGNLDRDQARLVEIYSVFKQAASGPFFLTLDGNEQYQDIEAFRLHWDQLRQVPEINSLLEALLFVEQPLHRDHALDAGVKQALADWPEAPPLIIDESEAEIGSLSQALELGYSGTSHKNCKGIVKGIANACLLEFLKKKFPDRSYILSGEDLANVGPIALLQDLAVMSLLGITHVERNGHHYFRGLSMLPEDLRTTVLDHHRDLYRKHEDGFPTLRITDGKLAISSVIEAPFGFEGEIDAGRFVSLEDWDGII